MAEIAGGSLHNKTIRPFCLDVTEVTVSAFKRCVERGRCVAGDTYEVNVHCNLDAPGRARHPINCVDLSHAQALCAKYDLVPGWSPGG